MHERAPMLVAGEVVAQRFRVVTAIREGGMAEIYEAIDEASGRKVALKVLKSESVVDPEALKRFERELNVLLGLKHPNLVKAYGRGRSRSGHLLLVLEWLSGMDLADLLELKGKLPAVEACRIARGLARGLGALHQVGVVHRDVKPENVFLSKGSSDPANIRLLDLGFAKLLGAGARNLTADGMMVGTVAYMAPEQAKAELDGRADLYALGIVLYECLVGTVPFHGETLRERVFRLAAAKEPPPISKLAPALPSPLAQVLERVLEPDPGRRFRTGEELEAALERIEPILEGK
ncbi:MAG: serine/threonine protein kinase [Deltaproteobacteria bacterium]|nr:serine/threonine protein kinase [Deltaproteobacteria bacterium]